MDSMSYRNNRPAQRPTEPEPTPAPASTPPLAEQPAAPTRTKRSVDADNKRSKKPLKILLLILVVAAIVFGAWYVLGRGGSTSSAIDGSKYQVVVVKDTLNSPTYFGKLSVINDDYMRLTKVFYLQKKSDGSNASAQSIEKQDISDFELTKLGNEIHGPEDEIIISTEQLLYFENLKPDGTVSKTITDFYQKK